MDEKDNDERLTVAVTLRATKEQIAAMAEKLFEETEFGVLVEMAAVDG